MFKWIKKLFRKLKPKPQNIYPTVLYTPNKKYQFRLNYTNKQNATVYIDEWDYIADGYRLLDTIHDDYIPERVLWEQNRIEHLKELDKLKKSMQKEIDFYKKRHNAYSSIIKNTYGYLVNYLEYIKFAVQEDNRDCIEVINEILESLHKEK